MDKDALGTTRRSFLSAAAIAAVMPPALATSPDTRMKLEAGIKAIKCFEATHFEDADFDSSEFNGLVAAVIETVDEIERLPITDVESLRLKVEAAIWCDDSLFHINAETTDCRLVAQILRAIRYAT